MPTLFTSRFTGRRHSGSVLVVVAMAMTTLLGFCAVAVDYGRMVATKNQLQRTCDAAALAGAAELASWNYSSANAIYQAQLTASQNNVNAAELNITFPASSQIRVTAARNVPYLFARVLGMESGLVNATALAGRSNIANGVHVSPLAMTIDDYHEYRNGQQFKPLLIDNNRKDFLNGTLAALDLRDETAGKAVAQFEDDLKIGWLAPVVFNQKVTSVLNASLVAESGALRKALDYRFTEAAKSPFFDLGPSVSSPYAYPTNSKNPRIMIIVVAEENFADNNNPTLIARFFAPLYIESYSGRGDDTVMTARVLPGITLSNDNPRLEIGDENTFDSGLSMIRLLG